MSEKTEKSVKTEVTTEVFEEIFQIVKNGRNYFIGVANNLVSRKEFATIDEAKNYILSKPWELIINVSCLLMDLSKKTENVEPSKKD